MSIDLHEVLRQFTEVQANSESRGVQGFSSLHPIMRFKKVLERRRGLRIRQNVPVMVAMDCTSYPAVLCDISDSGIGLKDIEHLGVGDYVSILIGKALTVRGVVVWAENGRAGVKLIGEH